MPLIGGTGNTTQFYQITGNNSGLTLDGGITVGDPNDITSATATISSGFESGDDLGSNLFQDTQTFLDGATISANFSAGGVLTLTTTAGSASASDYQTALQGGQYGFVPAGGDPSDGGLDKTRTITWSVTDTNGATSVAGSTTTLDVYMMPVLAAAASPTETWDSGAVTADPDLTVTDGNTIGANPVATVSVASGAQGGDELFIPAADLTGSTITGTTITVSGNDSTTLALTGTSGSTAAQFQTALDEVQFDAVTPNSGTRTLAWQFNDAAGGNANDSGPFSTTVDAVLGPPLTPGAVSVSGAVEGVTAGTLSAAFSDADTSDPASDFSGTIAWGDGATTAFTGAAVSGSNGNFTVGGSHTYAEEGSYSASVTIDHVAGSTATDTGTATVADAPLTAGAVSVSGAVEGVTAGTLSAAFSDANTGAPTSDFSGTIDWGDGSGDTNFTSAAVSGSNGAYTVSGSHVYAEEGNYSTTVTINDVGGSTATETGTATVGDAPLTAGAVSVSGAVEGVTAGTLSAAFSDANTGAPTSDFSGTIDWGDGTADTNFTSAAVSGSDGNFTVSGSHLYAEDGTYTTTVTVNDVGGSTATENNTATVADAALTPGAVSVSGAVEGTPGTLSATFSDANTGAPASDFSGTIDWGDGSADTNFTSAAVSGSDGNFTVSGSHTYAEDGNYTTTVTVDDVGGSTATESGTATVSQPFEVDNSPLSLSRGTTATIGPSLLRYGDIDTGPSGIAYTITGGPSDGTLLLNGSPTTSFTGAEVNNNELSYHETAGNVSSDSFTFTVANPFGATTPTQTFTIGISSGTPPFQLVDSPLSLTAGTTSAITLALLRYGDPSVGPQQETYTVTTAPADGTLLLSGSPTNSFTQADINNGLVSYHETVANMVSDSFSFVVSDPFGNATAPLSFPIQINPTTPPFQFADSTLSLGEGTTSTIGSGLLRFGDFNCGPQQETYAITTAPADGTLLLNGTPTSSFTEADINNGLVSYHETASAPSDSFAFTVTDPYGNATPTHTFQIAISPDPPPFEINNNPLTIALGGTAGIGHALLAFGDTGSSPQQEMFTVTGAPTNGALLLNGSSTTSFSEADINNGLVSYHETAGGASSDSFAFTVSGPFGNTTPTQHFQINI